MNPAAASWKMTILLGLMPFLLDVGAGVPVLPSRSAGNTGESDRAGAETTTTSSEVELQLEKLKGNDKSSSNASSKHDAPSEPKPTHSVQPKSELNLETPAVSDNSPVDSIWDVVDELSKRDISFPEFRNIDLTSTPHDIAEYIFWTGNEHSVTLALSELLNNEELSREEAIIFLEMVKDELETLRNRYRQIHLVPEDSLESDKQIPQKKQNRTNEKLPSSSSFEPRGNKAEELSTLNPILPPSFPPKHNEIFESTGSSDYDAELLEKVGQIIEERELSLRNKIGKLAQDLQRLADFVAKNY